MYRVKQRSEKKNIDMCEIIYTHTTALTLLTGNFIYFGAFPVLQIMKYL